MVKSLVNNMVVWAEALQKGETAQKGSTQRAHRVIPTSLTHIIFVIYLWNNNRRNKWQ